MKNLYLLLVIIITLILSSCKPRTQPLLPSILGNANDLIVVMSNEKWEAAPGDSVISALKAPVRGLPRDEPLFDLTNVPHDAFGSIFKKQRNILLTQIGPAYKSKVIVQKNVYANQQLIITITAPNPEEFNKLFESKKEQIVKTITETELKRLMDNYSENKDLTITEKLKEKHNIALNIPVGYTLNLDTNQFIWLGHEFRDIEQGILIYYYPYTDSNVFSKDYLIGKRDELLKQYITGEKEGSYVTTEQRAPVHFNEFMTKDKVYTAETRGLWHMVEGFAMGGPFVSISRYDEERKRIVTAEGFVFAPGHDKRDIIRRVEAIIYSLDFPDCKEKTASNEANS